MMVVATSNMRAGAGAGAGTGNGLGNSLFAWPPVGWTAYTNKKTKIQFTYIFSWRQEKMLQTNVYTDGKKLFLCKY